MHARYLLNRQSIYVLLRETLYVYAEQLDSIDIKLFALEMEMIPGKLVSQDPALFAEFNTGVPAIVPSTEAFALAADYVERELVGLRHIEAARTIVADLRKASSQQGLPASNLQNWKRRAELP